MTDAGQKSATELQEPLIDAALAHVPFDGWGQTALLAGARDLGIERGLALNAFPGGPGGDDRVSQPPRRPPHGGSL